MMNVSVAIGFYESAFTFLVLWFNLAKSPHSHATAFPYLLYQQMQMLCLAHEQSFADKGRGEPNK